MGKDLLYLHAPLTLAHPCPAHSIPPEEVTSTQRPPEVGLASTLASHMDMVSRRFEGDEWAGSGKEHFRVKGSASAAAAAAPPENRFLRAYRQRLESEALSDKQRRMSLQVRRWHHESMSLDLPSSRPKVLCT